MRKICIITCGSKKCITKTRADEMYIGTFFKAQLQWAKKHFKNENIYILSAKYGLLSLDDKILPYDLKMGQKGCLTEKTLFLQATKKNILFEKITSSAGKDYRKIINKVFKDVAYPFKHLTGMGYIIQGLKNA